jgi:hypothetical protein
VLRRGHLDRHAVADDVEGGVDQNEVALGAQRRQLLGGERRPAQERPVGRLGDALVDADEDGAVGPSFSCNSCGTTLGEKAHTALPQLDGSSFAHMVATSTNSTLLLVLRLSAIDDPALRTPCGLPTPLPWRKAYSTIAST